MLLFYGPGSQAAKADLELTVVKDGLEHLILPPPPKWDYSIGHHMWQHRMPGQVIGVKRILLNRVLEQLDTQK